jgi:hypothetical protein
MSTVASARLRKTDWTVRDVEIDVARRLVESEHYAKDARRPLLREATA